MQSQSSVPFRFCKGYINSYVRYAASAALDRTCQEAAAVFKR